MSNIDDKIQQLEDELDMIEETLAGYEKIFMENDGKIDAEEEQQLSSMRATIKTVKDALAKAKKKRDAKNAGKKDEHDNDNVPPKFTAGLKNLGVDIGKVILELKEAERKQTVNEAKFTKDIKALDSDVLELKALYSKSSDEVFKKCSNLLSAEESRLKKLKDDFQVAIGNKKNEVALDAKMKDLLQKLGSTDAVYENLSKKYKEVETKVQQFLARASSK